MPPAWPNTEDRGPAAVATPPPQIRHVSYDDFFALVSEGAGDLAAFRSAVDALAQQMGDPRHHPVLVDLRHATIGPLPEALLVEVMTYLRGKGLGRLNKVAFVVDRDDQQRRDRGAVLERIAAIMAMRFGTFEDYAAALDWLSEPPPGGSGPPPEAAGDV
jgi:hypothetical protein